jgi:hypothetical protein
MSDYVFRQEDHPKLNLLVNIGSDFLAWKYQWDVYISLSGHKTQAQVKQVQALTLCFSQETGKIWTSLQTREKC